MSYASRITLAKKKRNNEKIKNKKIKLAVITRTGI